jgi:hypothetical protein
MAARRRSEGATYPQCSSEAPVICSVPRSIASTAARFSGKPLRATYLSDLQRYADSLVGAPAGRPSRARSCRGWALLDEIAAHYESELGIIIPALEA